MKHYLIFQDNFLLAGWFTKIFLYAFHSPLFLQLLLLQIFQEPNIHPKMKQKTKWK